MRGVRVLAPTMTDLSHTYTQGTFRLLLGRHATNHPRKIIRHFVVRDPVRYSPSPNISCVLLIHQFTVNAHIREARANLAGVENLTHFPTLTNANRLDDVTWPGARDDYSHTDPTHSSHLPVRVRSHHLSLYSREGLPRF